jgi:hypothetical protein
MIEKSQSLKKRIGNFVEKVRERIRNLDLTFIKEVNNVGEHEIDFYNLKE